MTDIGGTNFGDTFRFKTWHLDTASGLLSLHYHSTEYGDFKEQYIFKNIDHERYNTYKNQIDSAINCLHWMAGVSYYKTSIARQIKFDNIQPSFEQAHWLTETWQAGLAELAHENKLPWLSHIKFGGVDKDTVPQIMNLSPRSLVAIGGGKDSLVSIEAIKSMDEDACLLLVGQSEFIKDVASHIDLPLISIARSVDSNLDVTNNKGAFNGHVPITAINACVAVVAALFYDFDSIVFSNERSADSGNIEAENGRWINHQYSKSLEYEKTWQTIIKQYITPELHCFSLMRPFSELAIVKKFSKLTQYFTHFSSCNRNFHLTGTKNETHHWCGECPKCAFVFLSLAPFVGKSTLLSIFHKDLFSDKKLTPLFESLLGLSGIKPFECVGEEQECCLALNLLQEHPDWKSHSLIQQWHSETPEINPDLSNFILQASATHLIPDKRNFLQVVKDVT